MVDKPGMMPYSDWKWVSEVDNRLWEKQIDDEQAFLGLILMWWELNILILFYSTWAKKCRRLPASDDDGAGVARAFQRVPIYYCNNILSNRHISGCVDLPYGRLQVTHTLYWSWITKYIPYGSHRSRTFHSNPTSSSLWMRSSDSPFLLLPASMSL